MKFSNLVILTATVMVATSAWAQQETQAPVGNGSTPGGVVILNTNSNSNTNTSASTATATAQPTTVVEASALADGKAEALRRARQNAEIQTEQKIVEKLEDSRLDDEQRRAERLFGERINTNDNVNATSAAAAATTVAPTAAPAVVNIEKIEIVQPAAAQAPVQATPVAPVQAAPVTEVAAPVVAAPAAAVAVEQSKGETADKIEKAIVADEIFNRMYVGFGIGSSNYYANNVDSSYSIGVTVGKQTSLKWAFEGFFNYSNHNVDTYWQAPLYREMNQYDFGGAGKYIFTNRGTWKPYVGGQAMFIYRTYTDRIMNGCNTGCAAAGLSDEAVTYAMNLGPNIGMDFEVNRQFAVGAEFMYNFNFVNKRDIDYAQFGVPAGTTPLEEISYYTLQITAKMMF